MNGTDYYKKYIPDRDKFKSKQAYRQAIVDGKNEFKKELTSHDLAQGFPKAAVDKAFEIAWDDAHSESFYAVENRYNDLIELVRITYDELHRMN